MAKKLADTSLAPATLEKYARGVTSTEREEAALKAAVARAEADVARTAAALADRPAAVAAANEARRHAQAALAGVKGSAAVNVQPWQGLYAELAKPPVILSGISSGEGVIFNIRDAREGRESKDDDPGVEQKFRNFCQPGESVVANPPTRDCRDGAPATDSRPR